MHRTPIMWVLISLVWVTMMLLPIFMASLEILKGMNMEPGDNMMKRLQIQNESRKIHAAYRMSESQLKKRKIIRHCAKKQQDKHLDKEGPSYEARRF